MEITTVQRRSDIADWQLLVNTIECGRLDRHFLITSLCSHVSITLLPRSAIWRLRSTSLCNARRADHAEPAIAAVHALLSSFLIAYILARLQHQMTEYPANIAPHRDGSSVPEPPEEAPEPKAISEQEVGEYREQDRYLPVRSANHS